MYEIILTVCMFANAYSVELVCEKQTLSELPSCGHVEIDQRTDVMIKGIECKKMVPSAPPLEKGQANA